MLHVIRRSQSSLNIMKNIMKSSFLHRTLTTSKTLAENYEGDGKTTVTILNREYRYLTMIDSVSNFGFRLNNGIFALGPLAVFPRTILQWDVASVEELTPESLSLFCLLEPKLDLLILGTGDKRVLPSRAVLEYLKSNNVSMEVLPTEQACPMFNFLNAEGRCIAGAFLPPETVECFDEETHLLFETDTVDDYSKDRFDYKRQK